MARYNKCEHLLAVFVEIKYLWVSISLVRDANSEQIIPRIFVDILLLLGGERHRDSKLFTTQVHTSGIDPDLSLFRVLPIRSVTISLTETSRVFLKGLIYLIGVI